MPYVSRGDDGNINGLFANLQPDFAEEYLPDDNPEVMAFLESTQPNQPTPTNEILFDHENRIRAQEGVPPLTLGDFVGKLVPK